MKFYLMPSTYRLTLVRRKTVLYTDYGHIGLPAIRETTISLPPQNECMWPRLLTNKHDIFLVREFILWIAICREDSRLLRDFKDTDDLKNFHTIPSVQAMRIYQLIQKRNLQIESIRSSLESILPTDLINLILNYTIEFPSLLPLT